MPDAIAATGGLTSVQQPQTADPFAGLDGEAFLRLLVAQLRYQNPMSPSDPSAMLQQTSQLRQVETLSQVAKSQQQMLAMNQASMASGMVGKTVSAVDIEGAAVEGVVDAVRFTALGPVLVIGAREVPLDSTTEIRATADPAPLTT
jgi:flagellar basal-body rod modification protein FlgD